MTGLSTQGIPVLNQGLSWFEFSSSGSGGKYTDKLILIADRIQFLDVVRPKYPLCPECLPGIALSS